MERASRAVTSPAHAIRTAVIRPGRQACPRPKELPDAQGHERLDVGLGNDPAARQEDLLAPLGLEEVQHAGKEAHVGAGVER